MEVNLLAESLKFMVLGMSVVFLFLLLMIFILKLLTTIIQKYFAKPISPSTTPQKSVSTTSGGAAEGDEQAKIAAITAAIAEFRKR